MTSGDHTICPDCGEQVFGGKHKCGFWLKPDSRLAKAIEILHKAENSQWYPRENEIKQARAHLIAVVQEMLADEIQHQSREFGLPLKRKPALRRAAEIVGLQEDGDD